MVMAIPMAVAYAASAAVTAAGGTALMSQVAFFAASYLASQALAPDTHQTYEAPRLADRNVQGSGYGHTIPLLYGDAKFAGNLIWATDIHEVKHVDKQDAGGKGGPSNTVTNITYTYYASFALGLAAREISAIRRIWADGKLIYADGRSLIDGSVTLVPANTDDGIKLCSHITLYPGTETQNPSPLMEQYIGAGWVPAHRGMAYLVFDWLPVGDYGNRIPNIEVETASSAVAGGLPAYQLVDPIPDGDYAFDYRSGALVAFVADRKPSRHMLYIQRPTSRPLDPSLDYDGPEDPGVQWRADNPAGLTYAAEWLALSDLPFSMNVGYNAWLNDGANGDRYVTLVPWSVVGQGLPDEVGMPLAIMSPPAVRAEGYYVAVQLSRSGSHRVRAYYYGEDDLWADPEIFGATGGGIAHLKIAAAVADTANWTAKSTSAVQADSGWTFEVANAETGAYRLVRGAEVVAFTLTLAETPVVAVLDTQPQEEELFMNTAAQPYFLLVCTGRIIALRRDGSVLYDGVLIEPQYVTMAPNEQSDSLRHKLTYLDVLRGVLVRKGSVTYLPRELVDLVGEVTGGEPEPYVIDVLSKSNQTALGNTDGTYISYEYPDRGGALVCTTTTTTVYTGGYQTRFIFQRRTATDTTPVADFTLPGYYTGWPGPIGGIGSYTDRPGVVLLKMSATATVVGVAWVGLNASEYAEAAFPWAADAYQATSTAHRLSPSYINGQFVVWRTPVSFDNAGDKMLLLTGPGPGALTNTITPYSSAGIFGVCPSADGTYWHAAGRLAGSTVTQLFTLDALAGGATLTARDILGYPAGFDIKGGVFSPTYYSRPTRHGRLIVFDDAGQVSGSQRYLVVLDTAFASVSIESLGSNFMPPSTDSTDVRHSRAISLMADGKLMRFELRAAKMGRTLTLRYGEVFAGMPLEVPGESSGLIRPARTEAAGAGTAAAGAQGVSLQLILEDAAARGNLADGELDASQLADVMVQGYLVSGRSGARSVIEQMQSAYSVYSVESGSAIKLRRLKDAPYAGEIKEEHLGFGLEQDSPRVKTARRRETELPRRIEFAFSDPELAYRINLVGAHRLGTSSEHVVGLQLPVVMPSRLASQVAQSLITQAWLGQMTAEIAVPSDYAYLEAGDVVTMRGRLWQVVQVRFSAPLALSLKLVRFEYSAYNMVNASSIAQAVVTDEPEAATQPALLLLDTQLLSAATDTPGLYAAAYSPRGTSSGGTALLAEKQGTEYAAVAAVPVAATVAELTTPLAEGAATTWAATDSITVQMLSSGSLYGCTKAEAMAGKNLALIGQEIAAFTQATDNLDGTYTLTGFVRGFGGAAPGAAVGDTLVMLDSNALVNIAQEVGELGRSKTYKLFGSLAPQDTATPVAFTNTGARLAPLAPVHLKAVKTAAEWQVTWRRQARKNAAWRDGSDVPLDQPFLKFEVDVLDAGGAVTGSYTVSDAEALTIASAASTLRVRVRQIGELMAGAYASLEAAA